LGGGRSALARLFGLAGSFRVGPPVSVAP
jgi:hypothetical protein